MLGQLCFLPSGRSRVRRTELYGLPVLRASLRPTGWWGQWRMERALRALQTRGVRTVLLPSDFDRWETLEALGLRPVDPVPLLQAAAGPLALALLARAGIAPTQATVALRGERAGPELRRAAELLCPQVRQLVIDAPRGGTALAEDLRRRFGVPLLPRETAGDVGVLFSPGSVGTDRQTLRLSSPAPDLAGLRLSLPGLEEKDREKLPLLAALWQAGRLPVDRLKIT